MKKLRLFKKGTTPTAPAVKLETDTRNKENRLQEYERLFLHKVMTTARSGKTVYISQKHHERILKILQVVGKNKISLFAYIDNVLERHLSEHQEDIIELYEKNKESIF